MWLHRRTSASVILHIKRIPGSRSFCKNTGFVGMRAAVSSGLGGAGPDNWRPRSEFLTGQEEGWREDIGNEKRKGRNKQKASQRSQWCGGDSTGARPKSGGGPVPWPPSGDRPHSADRVFWSTWAGAVVLPCLRLPGTCSGLYSTRHVVPKAAVFRASHGCEVDLYVKLSHSGLKSSKENQTIRQSDEPGTNYTVRESHLNEWFFLSASILHHRE